MPAWPMARSHQRRGRPETGLVRSGRQPMPRRRPGPRALQALPGPGPSSWPPSSTAVGSGVRQLTVSARGTHRPQRVLRRPRAGPAAAPIAGSHAGSGARRQAGSGASRRDPNEEHQKHHAEETRTRMERRGRVDSRARQRPGRPPPYLEGHANRASRHKWHQCAPVTIHPTRSETREGGEEPSRARLVPNRPQDRLARGQPSQRRAPRGRVRLCPRLDSDATGPRTSTAR